MSSPCNGDETEEVRKNGQKAGEKNHYRRKESEKEKK